MRDSRIDALSRVPLFTRLAPRQLRKLLAAAPEDRYDAGRVIVREGGRGDSVFVILEGTARVVRHERTVARRSEGEFFGEISMIDGRVRTASVIAETPIRCLVLFREDMKKIVMSDPQAAWAMLE